LLQRKENISNDEIYQYQEELLREHLNFKDGRFKIYIHPKFSRDVPDFPEFKLIILNEEKPDNEFIEKCGETPRVYRNTLIFLCADKDAEISFHDYIRGFLALKNIEKDKTLKLTDNQKNEIKNKIATYEQRKYEELRRYYRKLFLPSTGGFKEFDLGIPTFGQSKLNEEVYEYLRSQGEILEKISPKVIKDKYLSDKDFIEIANLYDAFLKTPGELRLVSKEALLEGIKEGVKEGLFGFGYIEGNEPKCKHIGEEVSISLSEGEIIVKSELVKKEEREKVEKIPAIEDKELEEEPRKVSSEERTLKELNLKLKVPIGQMSTIAKIVNHLNRKFSTCEVEVNIRAKDGEIERNEYENGIREALKQAEIEIIIEIIDT